MKRNLTRVVTRGHEWLAQVVCAGELVVDLTAGRGQDCLALWQMIGSTGQLIAFDVQDRALNETGSRLSAAGACVRSQSSGAAVLVRQPGADLVLACHSLYAQIVPEPVAAIIANLGYLPGGDHHIITRPETTVAALSQAADSLRKGGRMAVVVYSGHPGGEAEAEVVASFFAGLDFEMFEVIHLQVSNRHQAPSLFVAERRAETCKGDRC